MPRIHFPLAGRRPNAFFLNRTTFFVADFFLFVTRLRTIADVPQKIRTNGRHANPKLPTDFDTSLELALAALAPAFRIPRLQFDAGYENRYSLANIADPLRANRNSVTA